MTNCSPRPRMRWNGAIGAIERCKRASTACALRSRSRHELHLISGEKPKAKGVIRPFKPYMRHVQDESNPVPSLQSRIMSEMGKTHIVIMWTVGPDDVAEGDRIFESHGKWMKGHAREGPTALRSYSISKGPELSNPLDPDSSPTGNTIFVLDEFYESPAGPVERWRLARSSDPAETLQ